MGHDAVPTAHASGTSTRFLDFLIIRTSPCLGRLRGEASPAYGRAPRA